MNCRLLLPNFQVLIPIKLRIQILGGYGYGWQAFLEIIILELKTGFCANFYGHHCMYSKSGHENQYKGLTE